MECRVAATFDCEWGPSTQALRVYIYIYIHNIYIHIHMHTLHYITLRYITSHYITYIDRNAHYHGFDHIFQTRCACPLEPSSSKGSSCGVSFWGSLDFPIFPCFPYLKVWTSETWRRNPEKSGTGFKWKKTRLSASHLVEGTHGQASKLG